MYGIEKSAIADRAQEIVQENGFSDKITIIQGKVEDVQLPVEKVRLYACKEQPPVMALGSELIWSSAQHAAYTQCSVMSDLQSEPKHS